MKLETEITVLVRTNYKQLKIELEKNGFNIKEKYNINDTYLIDSRINISSMSTLDILKNCVIVREIVDITKLLLYKHKKYAINGDIIEQGKIECPIFDISKAIEFMKAIKYKKLLKIFDKCIVFVNDNTELVVQLVNDKYIFIEMEPKCQYIEREYKTINELKEDLCRYHLPIDNSNFFVKKAEILLNEILNRK